MVGDMSLTMDLWREKLCSRVEGWTGILMLGLHVSETWALGMKSSIGPPWASEITWAVWSRGAFVRNLCLQVTETGRRGDCLDIMTEKARSCPASGISCPSGCNLVVFSLLGVFALHPRRNFFRTRSSIFTTDNSLWVLVDKNSSSLCTLSGARPPGNKQTKKESFPKRTRKSPFEKHRLCWGGDSTP